MGTEFNVRKRTLTAALLLKTRARDAADKVKIDLFAPPRSPLCTKVRGGIVRSRVTRHG